MKRFRVVLLYLLLAGVVAGGAVAAITQLNLLGPRGVDVRGIITRDGKPLEWKGEGFRELRVIFIPDGERTNATPLYVAATDIATGSYEIKSIPPGTYKVSIQQHAPDPTYRDLLGMVYDPGSTNIVKEVTHDGQEIPIDLPRVLPPRRTGNSMPAGRPERPEGDDKDDRNEDKKDDEPAGEKKPDKPAEDAKEPKRP